MICPWKGMFVSFELISFKLRAGQWRNAALVVPREQAGAYRQQGGTEHHQRQ